jgi:hypothetical protein
VGLRLSVDEAVQRGRGRVVEWERVREGLPTLDSVLALAIVCYFGAMRLIAAEQRGLASGAAAAVRPAD